MKVRNLNNNYYATEEIMPLNETSLYRAVKEHDKNGYIIISAFRQDCLSDKKKIPRHRKYLMKIIEEQIILKKI